MKHARKHAMKAVLIGICLGIALLIVQRGLNIDEKAFMRGYWLAAPALVLGAVVINLSYNAVYLFKLRKLARLFLDEEPKKYVEGTEALLKTAKGQRLRSLLTLNLAGGYVGAKAYDKAIVLLEGLSDKALKSAVEKVVHRINLCMSYFYTARYEAAISLYNENQQLFQRFRQDKTYGPHIALMDVIAAILNKQFDQAQALLDAAKAAHTVPQFQMAFLEVEQTLNALRDDG